LAFHPHDPHQEAQVPSKVEQRAFFKPDLTISTSNVPLAEMGLDKSNLRRSSAWSRFFQKYGQDVNVWIDPRSGTPTNVLGAFPMIPGDGFGNKLTLSDMGQQLGRSVSMVDEYVVGEAVLKFISENAEVFGIDVSQLGAPTVSQVTEYLWQVYIPQQINGIPVRHGRVIATISHGNMILFGTESWGNANVRTLPSNSADQALKRGLERAGLTYMPTQFWKDMELEVLPFAPQDKQTGSTFVGQMGEGYAHRLAWVYGFREEGSHNTWEVSVDAHTGEVLAIEDKNQYLAANITGGIYPLTSTDICPTNQTCGTMQANSPMPWANTGLAAPNNFTNGAGVFNYTSGTVTTTLSGKYVRISDACGAVSATGSGNVAMGGTNGQHDCTTGGGGAGNTPASRSAFYEVNKLAELARGWLPTNTWLQGQLLSNVNINSTCNAFWNGSSINFYRSGGGCRNTGEIGAVFDHEWGHGMDDFDAAGALSNSSEAYADVAAIYRLQASCVGHGFFWTSNRGCGQTADGTGYNQNEAQSGAAHCNTDCSGVRDSDWAKHSDNTPDTPQNFVCTKCSASTGPCGRQVHCAAAPVRQAAWDLVTRDLRNAPFSYDSNTAFIIGNKLFYQGSGNVGTWHACDCTAGTSNGCGSTNGYMQWIAADDDNGNLNDGTPHMTAIHAAFNRHNIACGTPAPTNGGCSGGPTTAPTASATGGAGQVSLSWNATTGASKYWVMKSEGFAGCDFGKALVATVSTGTSYTDSEVAAGRQYCYNIVAVGASNACYSRASNCVCATPGGGGGDTTPPTTSITSPTAGSTVSGSVTISANASDNVGVTNVEFYVGSTLIGSDNTSPYSIAWNSASVANGTHTLTSRAYDAAGNSATSAGVSVTVNNTSSDTTPPTTSITSPTAGSTVSGTITISANASDNVGVTNVQFYHGSTLIGSDSTSPYSISWNTTTVANGTYSLTSRAYDAAGNVGTSAAVSVTVNNTTGNCTTNSQLLLNPGFESGNVSWTTTSGVISSSATYPARTGTWKAWLNGYGITSTDYAYQQITIPAAACTAQLSFWLRVDSSETTTTTQFDKLTVTVKNSAGTTLATLATYSNLNESTSYSQKTFDLAAYKGQTIRVHFNGTEDSFLQTSFIIDDTAVNITQ